MIITGPTPVPPVTPEGPALTASEVIQFLTGVAPPVGNETLVGTACATAGICLALYGGPKRPLAALAGGAVKATASAGVRALGALRSAGREVILDTNAVIRYAEAMTALKPGEIPVTTRTSLGELRKLLAAGRLKGMPRVADRLPLVDEAMDVHTRINIRGELVTMKPKEKGLFGDGVIGATAISRNSPIVTFDDNLAEVLRKAGVDVRTPQR